MADGGWTSHMVMSAVGRYTDSQIFVVGDTM